MLVEAEGSWTGHHQFTAERVTVDAGLLEKQIHYAAYLQEEPKDAERIKNGAPAELKVDGEWLLVDPKTKRSWAAPAPDRKSTRLNSSHGYISYAVFCLK